MGLLGGVDHEGMVARRSATAQAVVLPDLTAVER
jgi:hypothetical protein